MVQLKVYSEDVLEYAIHAHGLNLIFDQVEVVIMLKWVSKMMFSRPEMGGYI
jgi:hypothetical protein